MTDLLHFGRANRSLNKTRYSYILGLQKGHRAAMKHVANKGNYTIDAEEVIIGENVTIEDGVVISGIKGVPCKSIKIGDNCYFGRNTVILTPEFSMGDYGTIHKFCRISGYKPCIIGHNFWMDQNSILNCTDEVKIGNGVGIGAYSQLWTHIKHGDVLEGCRFNSEKPMIIEDDVWFVGHCLVSPIQAKAKSMAMLGSVITKDMEYNHIYGGCPAADLTPKIGAPYTDKTVEEKHEEMLEQKIIFFRNNDLDAEQIKIVKDFPESMDSNISYFNITTRTYTKRRSETEIKFMKHLLPLYKFIPE